MHMKHRTVAVLSSFPLLQYNDIVMNERERAQMAGTTAVAPNSFRGDADEGHIV